MVCLTTSLNGDEDVDRACRLLFECLGEMVDSIVRPVAPDDCGEAFNGREDCRGPKDSVGDVADATLLLPTSVSLLPTPRGGGTILIGAAISDSRFMLLDMPGPITCLDAERSAETAAAAADAAAAEERASEPRSAGRLEVWPDLLENTVAATVSCSPLSDVWSISCLSMVLLARSLTMCIPFDVARVPSGSKILIDVWLDLDVKNGLLISMWSTGERMAESEVIATP